MKVSVNWLRDYVDFDMCTDELAQRMTLAGLEVDKIHPVRPSFSGVIVAQVNKVSPHPNADKLTLCEVDTGSQTVSVVCGAPNVKEGILVPLAVPGADISGMKIKETKIRGEFSQGMICSERELGFSNEHSGIMILEDEFTLGQKLDNTEFGCDDIIELELTPNRGDCLSLIGVAREVAIMEGKQVKQPVISLKDHDEKDIYDFVTVSVEDFELCPRYTARVIKGVTIAPSPFWLKNRIEKAGIRSINNVVDITNYVLMEMGQPLHAFDYDLISGKKITVRTAQENEKMVTLDDEERTLSPEMLVIADDEKSVAIAGVMGGSTSEIHDGTVNVLLESAQFSPGNIRKTSKKLGLGSESSYRFERGIDPDSVKRASDRAAELIVRIAGGVIVPGIVDCTQKEKKKSPVQLRRERVNKVLGISLTEKQISDILQRLSIKIIIVENGVFELHVPGYRHDLTAEIDLIEEIARLYGYDRIPPQTPPLLDQNYIDKEKRLKRTVRKTRDVLSGLGLNEVITYSFINREWLSALRLDLDDDGSQPVVIMNPISEEHDIMRNSLYPGLVDTVSRNLNRGNEDIQIFEIGKNFFKADKKGDYYEKWCLGIALTENTSRTWLDVQPVDFFSLKGIIEQLIKSLFITDIAFVAVQHAFFHPGRCALLSIGSRNIGMLGEVHPEVATSMDIDDRRLYCAQIDLEALNECRAEVKAYTEISRYPAVTRDIAVIIDEKIPSSDVERVIRKAGTQLLEEVKAFDIYRGTQISEGKKSLAFSLRFRSLNDTLKDAQIDAVIADIRSSLKDELHCNFR